MEKEQGLADEFQGISPAGKADVPVITPVPWEAASEMGFRQ